MRAVLKMGALKLSFGGKQYIISQRIRSLVETSLKAKALIKLHLYKAQINNRPLS